MQGGGAGRTGRQVRSLAQALALLPAVLRETCLLGPGCSPGQVLSLIL